MKLIKVAKKENKLIIQKCSGGGWSVGLTIQEGNHLSHHSLMVPSNTEIRGNFNEDN